jgi:hypothetical protein
MIGVVWKSQVNSETTAVQFKRVKRGTPMGVNGVENIAHYSHMDSSDCGLFSLDHSSYDQLEGDLSSTFSPVEEEDEEARDHLIGIKTVKIGTYYNPLEAIPSHIYRPSPLEVSLNTTLIPFEPCGTPPREKGKQRRVLPPTMKRSPK